MTDNAETAILAGGCFWGVQELLRRRDGVNTTRVGYTGGASEDPTEADPGDHAEAVEVVFDPERISYRDLLEFFFQIHDPTTKDRQGDETGAYVRSEIFVTSEEQRRVAEEHDRRRRRLRPVARRGRDRDQRGRPFLGGPGRRPGLPPAPSGGRDLPLPAAGLAAATPRDRGVASAASS